MKLMIKKHWQQKQSDDVIRSSGTSRAQLIKEIGSNEGLLDFAKKHAEYPDDVKQWREGEVFLLMNRKGEYSGYGYVTLFLSK